ncbi:hypothetical protein [Stackebrandtia nassauensis]|nr:hypothetical protein [Stackebrandtia nassauensis]
MSGIIGGWTAIVVQFATGVLTSVKRPWAAARDLGPLRFHI